MKLSPGTRIRAKAFLFDMDGTLVDSNAVIERIWRRWAARHGVDAAALLQASPGRRLTETIARFATPGMDVSAEAASIVAEAHAETDGLVPVRGAAALLAALPAGRWAVVTSADAGLARRWLAAAGLPIPEILIAAEDVRASKPDPDGYLKALARLGSAAADAVVFEDAPAGLAAGRASGARTIAVATSLGAVDLDGQAWIADFSALAVEAGGELVVVR